MTYPSNAVLKALAFLSLAIPMAMLSGTVMISVNNQGWSHESIKVLSRAVNNNRSHVVFCDWTDREVLIGEYQERRMSWQKMESGVDVGWDVQPLGRSGYLLAEYCMVTERDHTGNILWYKVLPDEVIRCERLPNGNTFVATHSGFFELDATGQIVSSRTIDSYITDAQRLRSGNIVYLCQAKPELIEVAMSGKVIRRIRNTLLWGIATFSVLPDGGFLVAQETRNEVLELGPNGNILWRAKVDSPTTAARLPNGNTVVASRRNKLILELDKEGRVVWKSETLGGIHRLRLVQE